MTIDVKAIKEEIFRATPQHIIAEVIEKNYPNARITEQLIDSYLDIALTEEFTLDECVHQVRRLNPFSDVNNRICFTLEDNSRIAISEETFVVLQETINIDTVAFMRKSVSNFLEVVNILEEENGKDNSTPN